MELRLSEPIAFDALAMTALASWAAAGAEADRVSASASAAAPRYVLVMTPLMMNKETTFNAETAETAERNPKNSLRSLRALR